MEACCHRKHIKYFGYFTTTLLNTEESENIANTVDWQQYYCCSSGCSLIRLPKLYWTSSPLIMDEGTCLRQGLGPSILHIQSEVEPPYLWLPAPWEWAAGKLDPNLRFSLSNASNSTALPGSAAFACWQDFLLWDGDRWRSMCAAVFEILMGFPKSHTRPILKRVPGMAGEQARHDVIKQASQCVALANVIRMGMKKAGWETFLPSASQIASQRQRDLIKWPREKPPVSQGPSEIYDTITEAEDKHSCFAFWGCGDDGSGSNPCRWSAIARPVAPASIFAQS